jgi:tetratricopeptide (TPR) repeat protein
VAYKERSVSRSGVYSDIDHSEEAIAAHRQYVALAPNEPNAHDSLGLTFQRIGRYGEAIEEYERALALDPEFEVEVVHLGNVYFQQGRYREAIQQYRRYISIAPSDSERARGYGCVAHVYWKLGKVNQAQEMAEKEASYDNTGLRYSLTLALERGEMFKPDAINKRFSEWPYTSRGARPALRSYLFLLGLLNLKRGHQAEAIENFKELLRHRSLTWNIDSYEDCLANAYLALGQLDEAIAEYERILRINPNYPLAHYHLAKAFEYKNQADQAQATYQRFLQVWGGADTDIPELLRAKKRVAT